MKLRKFVVWTVRFYVGVAAGVVLHDTLSRMSLPIQPFIYQAF